MMIDPRRCCLLFVLVLAVSVLQQEGCPLYPSPQQEVEKESLSPSDDEVLASRIGETEKRIKELEENKELEEILKSKLLESNKMALDRLKEAQDSRSKATQFKQSVETAPATTKEIRKKLEELQAQPSPEPRFDFPPDTPSKEMENLLLQEQAALKELERLKANLDSQAKEQEGRPVLARQKITKTRQKLTGIEQEMKAAPPEESVLLQKARRRHLEARKLFRLEEVNMLEQELLSHGVRFKLLAAQREENAFRLTQAETRVKKLQEIINAKREEEAKKAEQEAERLKKEAEETRKHPAVQELIRKKAELIEKKASLSRRIQEIDRDTQDDAQKAKEQEEKFGEAKARLKIAGLSKALGQHLRNLRRDLPDERFYRQRIEARYEEIARLGIGQLDIEAELKKLRNSGFDAELEKVKEQARESGPLSSADEAELRKLLEDKRVALQELTTLTDSYSNELSELEAEETRLLNLIEEFGSFLDERLFYIPSTLTVRWESVVYLKESLAWIGNPHSWFETGKVLLHGFSRIPIPLILGLLLFTVLLICRRRFARIQEKITKKVGKVYTDSPLLTPQAMGVTLLRTAPWPLLMGLAAWTLLSDVNAPPFAKAVGSGLRTAAWMFLALQFMRRLCCPDGIAEKHFKWSERTLGLIRRNLTWLMTVLLPAEFVVAAVEWQAEETREESLGRLAFIVSMAAVAVFTFRIMRPRGVLAGYLSSHPAGWLARLKYVWFPAVVGLPLFLAGLSLAGYHYTALQLEDRLFATAAIPLGAVILHDLVMRWLIVVQRKLAVAQAREKREAALAAARAEAEKEGEVGSEEEVILDVPEVDLSAVREQTRHLVRTLASLAVLVGIWLVWVDVLPVLNILKEVELWQHTVIDPAEGAAKLVPITLAEIVLALLVMIVTTVAAKNLPGVLEIAVLQYLPLEPGSRYAITTVSRYIITGLGIVVICGIIGMSWSSIQWLVAALSVGLGFGLQEIVANFISGLILLFERPIRVGDTVTVGSVSGIVSRIRIRATTITDWDRKELVVPNKEFITGQLINWTLSDPITRVIIPVGIAYGSDNALAFQTLVDAAKANSRVLEKPSPQVLFLGFGESSLNYEVRVFVDRLGDRLPVMHELHTAIDHAFREKGIEIAFPQRDLHLRSMDVPVKLEGDEKGDKK